MIQKIAHTIASIDETDIFTKNVVNQVQRMQKNGWTVEIQYQQSTVALSALIIGRSED